METNLIHNTDETPSPHDSSRVLKLTWRERNVFRYIAARKSLSATRKDGTNAPDNTFFSFGASLLVAFLLAINFALAFTSLMSLIYTPSNKRLDHLQGQIATLQKMYNFTNT